MIPEARLQEIEQNAALRRPHTVRELVAEVRGLRKALTRIKNRDVNAKRPEARAWDYEQIAAAALTEESPDAHLTPTQPTPEEQVEAQKIAEDWLAPGWGTSLRGEKLATAYLALLTRQSQERAELEAQTRLVDSSFGKAEQYLQLAKLNQAELDRAVERLREVDRQLGRHLCYTGGPARKRFWQGVDAALSTEKPADG